MNQNLLTALVAAIMLVGTFLVFAFVPDVPKEPFFVLIGTVVTFYFANGREKGNGNGKSG